MAELPDRYFIVNKPLNMVSQFISSHEVSLLGNLEFDFPEGIHAIGRLDSNSEGMLILTTNKKITRLVFSKTDLHRRTYLVQVKNIVSNEALDQLRTGVAIRVKGGANYITRPCEVSIVENPESALRYFAASKTFPPFTWLSITLTEGKFHQVRKMVAAVRHRCLRLIRLSIEDLELGDLRPGAVKEIEETSFFKLLKIKNQ